uniref:Uncharacterized protein n=1 Tax=Oryza glumipatula TaxID=40148 RepID=A0A0D9ZCD6_9ORYZ
MFYSSAIHVHTSRSLQLATLALLSEMLGRGLLPTSHTRAAAAAPALLLAYGQRWKRGDKGRDNGERGGGGGRRGRREMMACGPIVLMDSSVRYGSSLDDGDEHAISNLNEAVAEETTVADQEDDHVGGDLQGGANHELPGGDFQGGEVPTMCFLLISTCMHLTTKEKYI